MAKPPLPDSFFTFLPTLPHTFIPLPGLPQRPPVFEFLQLETMARRAIATYAFTIGADAADWNVRQELTAALERHKSVIVNIGIPKPATACSRTPKCEIVHGESYRDIYSAIFDRWHHRPGIKKVEVYSNCDDVPLVYEGIGRIRSEWLSSELMLTDKFTEFDDWQTSGWVRESIHRRGDFFIAIASYFESGRRVRRIIPFGRFWRLGPNDEDVAEMSAEINVIAERSRRENVTLEVCGPLLPR